MSALAATQGGGIPRRQQAVAGLKTPFASTRATVRREQCCPECRFYMELGFEAFSLQAGAGLGSAMLFCSEHCRSVHIQVEGLPVDPSKGPNVG